MWRQVRNCPLADILYSQIHMGCAAVLR
jgi:hypothetical protein